MAELALASSSDEGKIRCPWATGPWLIPYHDQEWGVAVHDDRTHFELLALEGAQAGLSWLTVLKRRAGYRRAFAGFDPAQVARFDAGRVQGLLIDPGIIRHRQKVEAAVGNAIAMLRIQAEVGSFDAYIWGLAGGRRVVNHRTSTSEIPTTTPLAKAVSSDLRRRGFRFTGPTICYSYLQAAGLVVDHLVSCFRYQDLACQDAQDF